MDLNQTWYTSNTNKDLAPYWFSRSKVNVTVETPLTLPCPNLVKLKSCLNWFVLGFFLFITTLRTSIQCHIFISVYLDYWSLAYQWYLYVPPPPFPFEILLPVITLASKQVFRALLLELVDTSDIYLSTLVFYTRHRVNITIYRTVCTSTPFSFWNITVLWSNTKQIVINHICVIFSRRTMSLSIGSMVQLYIIYNITI
jgi:hypothetical protein